MAKRKAKAKAKEAETTIPVDVERETVSVEYLGQVRQALMTLGSNDPDRDVRNAGDFVSNCKTLNVSPQVCAATIYSGVRHQHEVARTVIKENASAASEAPVRETWEVVVKRGGVSVDEIVSAAGRRSDEVTAGNVVFAGFNDDEKAATFSKKMTAAGYIAHYGPRREYTLHEDAREVTKRQELGALMLNWHASQGDALYAVGSYYVGDMKYPRKEMVESARNAASRLSHRMSSNSTERRELRKIVRGLDHYALVDYPASAEEGVQSQITAKRRGPWHKITTSSPEDAKLLYDALSQGSTTDLLGPNLWTNADYRMIFDALNRTGVKAGVHRETEEAYEAAHAKEETPAASPSEAVACDSCIPWQKVSRDPGAHAEFAELSKKYGPIKDARDVYRVVGDALVKEDAEVFLVIPLDLRSELKAWPYEIARGQYSRVGVGVENVMAAVYASHCEAFVCVHNHPSGRVTPSSADKHLTDSIRDACKPLGKGVTFVDHVVVGHKRCYSITEGKSYKIA